MTSPSLLLCEATFIAALLLLLYQDLRTRSVHVMVLVALVLFALGHGGTELSNPDYWRERGLNLLLLLIQTVLLGGYLRWRKIRPAAGIGVGDFIFWVIPAFYLPTLGFALFFPLSLCLALVLHLLSKGLFAKTYGSTVPLAGFQALCLAGWIVLARLGFSVESHLSSIVSLNYTH